MTPANIESTVAGIPCLVQIDYAFVQRPLGPSADSDWDCYGYADVEFTILDRRGRPAPWLEKKMTASDKARVEADIVGAA